MPRPAPPDEPPEPVAPEAPARRAGRKSSDFQVDLDRPGASPLDFVNRKMAVERAKARDDSDGE